MADKNSGSPQEITDPCEQCIQKELCPVYMGEYCILVNGEKNTDEKNRHG